jgi:hypothetical protein
VLLRLAAQLVLVLVEPRLLEWSRPFGRRSLNGFIGFELHELLHGWSKAIAWLWLRAAAARSGRQRA